MKSKVNITSSLQLAYEEVGEGENILLLLSGAVGKYNVYAGWHYSLNLEIS